MGTKHDENDRRGDPHIDLASLAALLQHIDEAIVVVDDASLITFASPGVRSLLGYDPDSVLGRSLLDFLHPDEIDDILEGITRWSERSGTPRGQVQQIKAADGSWTALHYDTVIGAAVGPLGSLVITLRLPEQVSADRAVLLQRLMNEDRLVRLASAFLHSGVEKFDEGLQQAVDELAGLEWVTRVSVWTSEGTNVVRRAMWEAARNAPKIALPERLRHEGSHIVRHLVHGEEVHIRSVEHLPDDWAMERDALQRAGVFALLAVPMQRADTFTGFVMLEVALRPIEFDATHVSTLRSAAAILADAFARHEVEVELDRRARTDQLTDLPNRWAFQEELDAALSTLPTGEAKGIAVAVIDLDRFKTVNDGVGHQAGDRVLRDIAARFSSNLDNQALLARLGGDSWLVLYPDVATPYDAAARTSRLLSCLETPLDVNGRPVILSASAGLAHTRTGEGLDAIELLRRADVARFRAKELGGDRIEIDDVEVRALVTSRLERETELRQAIDNGAIVAYLQAEWDLGTGLLLGAEALARWVHPTRGVITAERFVPLAEDCGLVHELGTRVLRETCATVAEWRRGGRVTEDFVVRVNLSARQLHQPDLTQLVAETLADTDLPAASLCLELTESSLLVDPERSVAVLGHLRDLGVGLALDDFGTGFSSMLYLKRLPLSSLKIDRAFVSGLPDDIHDRAIVAATVQLADALGITVTAEGVETAEQRDALLAIGCRRAQGFLLARPEPAEEFATRLPAAS